ncbi:AraC family transcriptional regulator [Erwinia persicina]|uniref:AraC family transcriptional regulator n=1 Tax=Erwinia persicina TaxID=55211 RepID=UPI000E92B45B|nr:AraC family transcriptional regulator [Erwinia persicina]MCQ4093304.1 AraC family transcriptional regulator [Erwinia persicina]MCQ4099072.1 AraC family transcriptional regulator [Erwinia persicina]QZQ51574.1 AraC family transcriptional regulator [Erwinia persicina]HBT11742.1 AraC family transcriptional regulator [Erwinia persicina]
MDPLSDILALLKPQQYVSGVLDVGGDWAVRFPPNAGIKCYSMVSGGCWLSVEGETDPVRLSAGDCFLLPTGRPFVMASDLSHPATDWAVVFAGPRAGGVIRHNGGGDCLMTGSRFFLDDPHATILLTMLPAVIHLRAENDQATLRWLVAQMMAELDEQRPGHALIAEHLAHMILIQALRQHMESGGKGDAVGWLYALADHQLGAALQAMHADPAYRWTLPSLAQRAGMSRSAFALKFKTKVGSSTMDYLTRWRMLLAGDKLLNTDLPISALAPSLGYESESAFSTAFKRTMGCSPRDYVRRHSPPGGRSR